MNNDNQNRQDQFFSKWSKGGSFISSEVEKEYDTLAQVYEENMQSWNYSVHHSAAELMEKFVATDGEILDIGCGTGLAGQALKEKNYQTITGIDISQKSLNIAKGKNIYIALKKTDIQQELPFQNNKFDGIICTAVMTNIGNPEILYEFWRLVKPGGHVVFTNREDIHFERKFNFALEKMELEGVIKQVYLSSPKAYLPGHDEYSDKIKVLYCVCQVCR